MSKAAVLIFADAVARDLSRRQWPAALTALLPLPDVTAAGADVHLFTTGPVLCDPSVEVHRQRGRTFGRRLENAVADLAAAGYEKIVIIGRDCPELESDDVAAALASLDRQATRLVLGPDHAGGCWLIALRSVDAGLLNGIKWRRGTDRAALARRAGPDAVALLDVKVDLDATADLRRVAPTDQVIRALARLGLMRVDRPFRADRPPATLDVARHRWQLPPPARRAA